MIEDRTHYDAFIKWLPELQDDEVYFLSLSARDKYLNEEERKFYSLGRTEMFSRFLARDKEGIEYVTKKLRASLAYRLTRSGQNFPEKALVTYMNVNPCSMINAYNEFKTIMDKNLTEFLFSKIHNKGGPSFEPWHRLERNLLNCVQRNRARKLVVDIDIDTKDEEILGNMQDFLREKDVDFRTIGTQGGYHVLINKNTLNRLNIWEKVKELDSKIEKEVCINKNGMVPLPGTLQAGKLVTFI